MGAWTVLYYEREDGRSPVEEWLSTLQPGEQAAMLRLVDYLERSGLQLRWPRCQHLEGTPLWELRASFAGRIFYFAHIGPRFVLLHGNRKKSQKAPQQEINIALRRYHEVIGREEDNG